MSGCLSEKQKDKTKERYFPVLWKLYKEGAGFPSLGQSEADVPSLIPGTPQDPEGKPLLGTARVTGCHAAALELPVPPNLLGGQQCQLSLGPSRVRPPVSVLGAYKAWSKEATTTAAAATTTAAIATTAATATATSEEAKGPQHRPVSPCDVFHGASGPGWIGVGDVSALPPTEGAGRAQRGKLACGLLCPGGTGGHTALSQCRGPRGLQSCTVLSNPFFLSQKWIVLDIFFDRELQAAPMRKRNSFCWGKKGSRP